MLSQCPTDQFNRCSTFSPYPAFHAGRTNVQINQVLTGFLPFAGYSAVTADDLTQNRQIVAAGIHDGDKTVVAHPVADHATQQTFHLHEETHCVAVAENIRMTLMITDVANTICGVAVRFRIDPSEFGVFFYPLPLCSKATA